MEFHWSLSMIEVFSLRNNFRILFKWVLALKLILARILTPKMMASRKKNPNIGVYVEVLRDRFQGKLG